jgi:hypothetical protein
VPLGTLNLNKHVEFYAEVKSLPNDLTCINLTLRPLFAASMLPNNDPTANCEQDIASRYYLCSNKRQIV